MSRKTQSQLTRFYFTSGEASMSPFFGPWSSIQEYVDTCSNDPLLQSRAGGIGGPDATVIAVKNSQTGHITLYTRNNSISEDVRYGWEEVGKDLASYITFTDGPYDILTVINPEDPEHPVEYELNKRDTFTTSYGEISIPKFEYTYIPLNGGTIYPQITINQQYTEDHTRLADVTGNVPMNEMSISYSISYTENADLANQNRIVTSANGAVTRQSANSVAGQRCKIAEVTVTVQSHGKTKTATADVYQDVVKNKTYTVVSSSLSYPVFSNAGTETITPSITATTRETITYMESSTVDQSTQTHSTFYSTSFSGSTSAITSHLNVSTGAISNVGLGTYRNYNQGEEVKSTLGVVTASVGVVDSRDVNSTVLTTNPTFTLKQDTRSPLVVSYNYKAVVTEYSYANMIPGDGTGNSGAPTVIYKIQHQGVREDGSTAAYADYQTALTPAAGEAAYSISGTAVTGVSVNASTGVVSKSTPGSVSATTSAGTMLVTISKSVNDELTGESKTATGSKTAAVTQAIRIVNVYYGTSENLLEQGDDFSRTNSLSVTNDIQTSSIQFSSNSDYTAWFAVPDGYSINVYDAFNTDSTSDWAIEAVTTTGYTIYQYPFDYPVGNTSITLRISKD